VFLALFLEADLPYLPNITNKPAFVKYEKDYPYSSCILLGYDGLSAAADLRRESQRGKWGRRRWYDIDQ
jgi:hypothetical protein